MRKLLPVLLALVLIVSVVAVAEDNFNEPVQLDVGVSLLESNLTLRGDYSHAYFKLPITDGLNRFKIGAKTNPLIFDVYGVGGFHFVRTGDDILSSWDLANYQRVNLGLGRTIQFDKFKLRLEGLAFFNDQAEVSYGADLTFSYTFEFGS